ncbi:CsgBAC operon transcriptional regulatory protein [Ruminiclostridium hungatei]|uniref:CsgBAC operon transcriptional regulatory protein n=1 Tax=Ruminiclostridium hungatei TaxID=48256 RepID=A0A1V4SNJ0_RUMHU|nr:LuxR C-terminal-related transcriptional regulator [Ruminiclostridium hungatei]OPX45046.1 CsgBAC operon transcriptional regulatory protein [Ruminiclostridium hungatei]
MVTLKEMEWNRINELLLEIYSMDNEHEIADRFLKIIRGLIPYSQGFILMSSEENEINAENSSFINISEKMKNLYIDHFYKVDYINYIINDSSTLVFKDTEILENSLRVKSELYLGFLKPQNIEYGCGIIFIKEGNVLGVLNLFRSADLGDFSDRDIRILHLVKDHMTNIIHSLRKSSKSLGGRLSINFDELESYKLSKREKEIIQMMIQGLSNQDISDKYMISISTVKKHVYNIFTKIGINSRMQLLKIFGEQR